MTGGAPFRLAPWPFPEGEIVTLAWLRSPYMEGLENQWKFGAVFRSRWGEPRELSLDWAMLPLMAPGQRYRDGKPLENSFETRPSRVNLSKASAPEMMTTRQVLPESLYQLDELEEWQEHCWVWNLPGRLGVRVIVPVLVLLRGLFAQGSFLTTGLLNEFALDTLAQKKVDGRVLRLHFPASVPLPVRVHERGEWVTWVTRLLCDPTFEAAYRSVALYRVEDPGGPLRCDLPALFTSWNVRVLSRDNILLVQDILYASPQLGLPVDRVEYVHPLYPRRVTAPPTPNTTRLVREHGQPVVDIQGPASKIPKTRYDLRAPPAALAEPNRPGIVNVGPQEEGLKGSPVRPWKGGGERLVSLAGTGRNAKVPQAGVRPGRSNITTPEPEDVAWEAVEEWAELQTDGLNALREMLATFWRKYPKVNLVFRLGPKMLVGNDRTFDRSYAVVAFAMENRPPMWLIEFAKRPERPLSTLILHGEPCAEWDTFEGVLTHVLTDGLDRQEWWNRGELAGIEEQTGVIIRRLPHTAGGAERWAERVFALLSPR